MKLGIALRSMGPQSTAAILGECAHSAEAAGLSDIWVQDHIAIPPDDAEGSGGRYLDPLATLAWLAARTERIGLGTGVINLPYRPALPTAKAIATIQELSGGRLLLGVGVGWMKPEFQALGVDRRQRGALTDQTLAFLHECFGGDQVEVNGQPFLFLPRPARPPIFVGGAPPHAFKRTITYGDGWLPMARDAAGLGAQVTTLREQARAAGRPDPEVVVLTGVDLRDSGKAKDSLAAFREAGATRLILGTRYEDAAGFRRNADALAAML